MRLSKHLLSLTDGYHDYLINSGGCSLRRGLRSDQFADAIRKLSTLRHPIVDAFTLELEGGWVGAGVIGAYDLDRATIAGTVLFNHNNTVVGLLTGADARQPNHQHWKTSQ